MIAVLTDIVVSLETSDREWLQINREAAMATFYASPDQMGLGIKGFKGNKDGAGILKIKKQWRGFHATETGRNRNFIPLPACRRQETTLMSHAHFAFRR